MFVNALKLSYFGSFQEDHLDAELQKYADMVTSDNIEEELQNIADMVTYNNMEEEPQFTHSSKTIEDLTIVGKFFLPCLMS